jgi:hypothetical protein
MPDTTKPSWACDWCGKERFKGDCGFDARYTVKIESSCEYSFIFGCHIREDKYVCFDCIGRLEKIISGSTT